MRQWRSFVRSRLGLLMPTVFVVAGLVVAMTPLAPNFFEGAPYAQAAVAGSLGALVAALVQKHLPVALSLVVGLVGGTAALMVVLADVPRAVGVPGAPGPVQLWSDVANGWSNLLAAPQPSEMSAELLALPIALCWVAAYLTVLLVAASRSAVLSVVPLVATAVAALLLGPGSLTIWSGGAIAAATLAHIAARAADAGIIGEAVATRPGESRPPLWRYAVRSFVLIGVPAIVVSGLVGGAVAVAIGGDPSRTDLHDPPAIEIRDELTPLSRLRVQLRDPDDRELFTIGFEGATGLDGGELDRVRIATLEHYDGALWTSTGVFLPVIRRVRLPDESRRSTVEVTAEVRLTPEYDSSYLPVVGMLQSVDGEQLGLNERTDTLVTGLERGSPMSFGFTSEIPVGPRPEERSEGDPPGGGDASSLEEITLPVAFDEFIVETVGDTTDASRQLTLLVEAMTSEEGFGYSFEDAYSGHTLPVLAAYLSRQPPPGFDVSRQGYAEQAAAAFTLMARQLGLPARVAVGYLISDAESARNGEQVSVRTSDAHAWSEVFLGDEWISFDPTNREERSIEEITPPTFDEAEDEPEEVDDARFPIQAPEPEPEPETTPWRIIVPAIAAVLLLMLPLAIKFVRRRVRRGGSPSKRLTGAWRELRDRLRDGGQPVTLSTTPRDLSVAFVSPDPAVADGLERFAQLTDRGLFAPTGPDDQLATEAWSLVPVLTRGFWAGRPRWRRLLARFDPRSLRRPRRGKPPLPERGDPKTSTGSVDDGGPAVSPEEEDETVIDLRDETNQLEVSGR